ncbi:hypothetical protein [Bacillus subtilis]|uniref:Uncharacterized protein n=1 Tax=Bacillus subtilis TaxID=1423 RepID=A0A8I1WE17_BACIU|nr:hypothetical protein [Bacillus subtilis]KAF2421745.1 hypothetical protein B6K89_21395 [Bacillus subtilis]MBO3794328.1 hypothetical protein [Bacillus subtilis]
MKLEFKLDWIWILRKLRVVFFTAIFCSLYYWYGPIMAFGFIVYIVLTDIQDIETTLYEIKEEKSQAWKNISPKRRDF